MRHAIRLFIILFFCAMPATAQSPPCPAGKVCSGGLTFTVTFQAPQTPASVSPTSVAAGAPQTTITLTAATGSTFNNTMIVEWCQQTPTVCTTATDLTTTFVSASSLTAVLPANLLTSSGTFLVYLSQPSSAHAVNLQWNPSTTQGVTYNAKRGAVSGGPTQWSLRASPEPVS